MLIVRHKYAPQVRVRIPEAKHTYYVAPALHCRSEREFLTKRLEEVEVRLQDARSDRKAAGRERKHKEALDALKRMYPSSECAITAAAAAAAAAAPTEYDQLLMGCRY